MKSYEQITFDFNEASAKQDPPQQQAAAGFRIKSLKQPTTTPEQPELLLSPAAEEISPVVDVAPTGEVVVAEENITSDTSAEEVITVITPVTTAKKSTRGRKSLKELEASVDLITIPADEELFKKQYYSIGEVADMFRVNQSLLRFWENEFDILQPRKNRKGDRHFRPVDIKNLELIYDLLRRRKLTIEGAKDFLKKNKTVRERFETIQSLQNIKSFLLEIKARL